MKYGLLRPQIRTGGVLLFRRLTLRQAWRGGGLRALPGWLAGWVISLRQLAKTSRRDGCWNYVHAAFAVRNYTSGEALVAEWTAGQTGPGMKRLSERVAGYPGGVVYVPLYPWVQVLDAVVQQWLDKHRLDAYDYTGLVWPTLSLSRGRPGRGRMICSAAVASMLQWCGALPPTQRIETGRGLATAEVCPWQYSPDTLAGLRRILDWDNAVEVEP